MKTYILKFQNSTMSKVNDVLNPVIPSLKFSSFSVLGSSLLLFFLIFIEMTYITSRNVTVRLDRNPSEVSLFSCQ